MKGTVFFWEWRLFLLSFLNKPSFGGRWLGQSPSPSSKLFLNFIFYFFIFLLVVQSFLVYYSSTSISLNMDKKNYGKHKIWICDVIWNTTTIYYNIYYYDMKEFCHLQENCNILAAYKQASQRKVKNEFVLENANGIKQRN